MIPVHVLTGFLGSGKTTLLNRLLRAPELATALVIINEWGQISLDHLLIERLDGDVMILASGCLCCTLRGDLVEMLSDLSARRDGGALAPFDRVIIETSGLADPNPILRALIEDAELAARFSLAGVVTMVDAVNGLETLDRHAQNARQVGAADALVLSKSDLLARDQRGRRLAMLATQLRGLNPSAEIFDAAAGEFGAVEILRVCDAPRIFPHGSPAHGQAIASYCYQSDIPVARASLEAFFGLLAAALGSRLLRVKGLAALRESPELPLVVQGVQHVFHTLRRLPAWPDGQARTRLVIIAEGVDRAKIDALWSALTGQAQIDTPDFAALTANPLAPGAVGLLR